MFGLTTTDMVRDLADEEILARSQKEPWIFAVLLDRYQDAFMRKARGIVRSEEDAEEVVQDAFTKIYQNAHRFEVRTDSSFSSWGYRILMNTAFTRYQKLKRERGRVLPAEHEIVELVGSDRGEIERRDHEDAVTRVLERLPGHFAVVLRLHYLERWSHKDIAAQSGETVGTIKARIHRAKASFRKEAKGSEAELLVR
ncbi:MAG: sigma-70 family RNA polymerase sigma factor [Candidatus Paceibacterota bacterium]